MLVDMNSFAMVRVLGSRRHNEAVRIRALLCESLLVTQVLFLSLRLKLVEVAVDVLQGLNGSAVLGVESLFGPQPCLVQFVLLRLLRIQIVEVALDLIERLLVISFMGLQVRRGLLARLYLHLVEVAVDVLPHSGGAALSPQHRLLLFVVKDLESLRHAIIERVHVVHALLALELLGPVKINIGGADGMLHKLGLLGSEFAIEQLDGSLILVLEDEEGCCCAGDKRHDSDLLHSVVLVGV
mmetsp:Transcript_7537/g.25683  ORF Transcript_7537/g.25683 Transcript_7537/m.25683 type:complete len:240 (-) Transcript_7537:70-789(-)